MSNYKKKGKWKVVLLSALCVLLTLVLLAVVFAAIVMENMLGRINRVQGTEETLSASEIEELLNPTGTIEEEFTGPVYAPEEVTMPTAPAEIIETEGKVNILLIGQDRRGTTGRSLSDAMILCTINKKTKTITMTSFLRDTYVQIPGYNDNKLNVAYPVGGMKLLDETLELNFGVTVDGNVEVDFRNFAKIVDLLGGVDVELTAAEAAYLNRRNSFGLRQGVNHLNGEAALAYSRIRYIGTDFGRTNRQRTVLTALFNRFRDASMSQLIDALTGILDLITTDMTDQEILSLAMDLAPMMKDMKIASYSIPIENSYTFGAVKDRNVVSCIFIDFDVNRKFLQEILAD